MPFGLMIRLHIVIWKGYSLYAFIQKKISVAPTGDQFRNQRRQFVVESRGRMIFYLKQQIIISFKKKITKMEFNVRRAIAEDFVFVREMVQELADFEKMSHGPKLKTDDLIRDAGLSESGQLFHCYIVEANSSTEERPLTSERVGYAICFFGYSTWEGKTYFLEDLYVKPKYRKQGIGYLLFKEVAKAAKNFNCSRINFHVLNWNPARNFYHQLGAISITEKEGWHFYVLNKQGIDNILK